MHEEVDTLRYTKYNLLHKLCANDFTGNPTLSNYILIGFRKVTYVRIPMDFDDNRSNLEPWALRFRCRYLNLSSYSSYGNNSFSFIQDSVVISPISECLIRFAVK